MINYSGVCLFPFFLNILVTHKKVLFILVLMWPEIVFIHCQRLIDSDHSLQKLQNSIVGKFLFPD